MYRTLDEIDELRNGAISVPCFIEFDGEYYRVWATVENPYNDTSKDDFYPKQVSIGYFPSDVAHKMLDYFCK